MELIYNPLILEHNAKETETEGPYRLEGVAKAARKVQVGFDPMPFIRKVHSDAHIAMVKEYCFFGKELAETHASKASLEAALFSAGAAVLASYYGDFALVRPPGHHAGRETAEGFCYFNNVAIAAMAYVEKGKKVCIIDIDGHHGNGTESIFYDNPNVLFCSLHQEGAWPEGKGSMQDIGEGKGKGLNMNIVLPESSGDDLFLKSVQFLEPYVRSFNPQVIGVSAGFDGYHADRLLNLEFTLRGFYEAGKAISSWGRQVFAVLEGGYHKNVLWCAASFVDGVEQRRYRGKEDTSFSEEALHELVDDRLAGLASLVRR